MRRQLKIHRTKRPVDKKINKIVQDGRCGGSLGIDFLPVDKDGFIARFFPTLLFVEMYHSLNICVVLSNSNALLFAGSIMFR